ncbi:5410_t:CDS:2 [Funneliformis caledonium]|uniref:5410_t:CDS:1 n=1 Tax=Funneliformis caledonium TaxID=1117310 RepID=A0A9N9HQ67_9GLOM|nr:5410_t:CDS:2 [Funneliformis caledonium]
MYKNIHVPYPFTDNAKKIHSCYLIAPDYENNKYSLPNEYVLRFTWKSNYTAPLHEKLKAGAKVIDVAYVVDNA